ncbi:hypothetical protein BR93DRAFT_379567 [Coniochaeta sp. PMI_546]|nr:hypothetical protein BR93DRAFT_379567 [Coniochaeta sp. PMI_546]
MSHKSDHNHRTIRQSAKPLSQAKHPQSQVGGTPLDLLILPATPPLLSGFQALKSGLIRPQGSAALMKIHGSSANPLPALASNPPGSRVSAMASLGLRIISLSAIRTYGPTCEANETRTSIGWPFRALVCDAVSWGPWHIATTRPTRRLEARCKAWRESVNERLNLQPVAEYGVAVSWFMGLPGERRTATSIPVL